MCFDQTRLAEKMPGRALDAGVAAGWVAADSAYGRDGKFRAFFEARRLSYMVEVPVRQTVSDLDGSRRVDTLVGRAPTEAWHQIPAGPGVRDDRKYDWTWATLPSLGDVPVGYVRTLLAFRYFDDPGDTANYLCFHPATVEREQIVRGRSQVSDRGMLPSRQTTMRPGPLPSPPLRHLIPRHHPGQARPHLPLRHYRHRPKSHAGCTGSQSPRLGPRSRHPRPMFSTAHGPSKVNHRRQPRLRRSCGATMNSASRRQASPDFVDPPCFLLTPDESSLGTRLKPGPGNTMRPVAGQP